MTAHDIARAIAARIHDPAHWAITLRALAEKSGLDVTRCIPVGTCNLVVACSYVSDEARKQGPDVEALLAEAVHAL